MIMRLTLIVLSVSCLFACKRKAEIKHHLIKSAFKTADKSNTLKVIQPDTASRTIASLQKTYPDDSVYSTRILTADGVFHEDEVDPASSRYLWMGIFKNESGFYTSNTKINLAKAYDAVLDDEGKKTGWLITTSIKDTALLLVSGINDLPERPVEQVKLNKQNFLPGEQEQFTYKGIVYTIYATGRQQPESLNSKNYYITDYKLFLKVTIGKTQHNQLLASADSFDDALTTILFAGDIDGDGLPDFIIDTTNHYNVQRPTLYLSKPAGKGQLLRVVGMHSTVGC